MARAFHPLVLYALIRKDRDSDDFLLEINKINSGAIFPTKHINYKSHKKTGHCVLKYISCQLYKT